MRSDRAGTRQLWGFLAAALGIVAVIFVFAGSRAKEPIYRDRRLSEWVSDFNRGEKEYAAASGAVRAMGTNALPGLLRLLRHSPEPWLNRWIPWINRQPFFKIARRPNGPYPEQVVSAFIVLGTNVTSVLPQLNEIFLRSTNGIYASEVMTLAAPVQSLPYLAAALQQPALVRSNAAVSLRNLGTYLTPAMPLLLACLVDRDAGVRTSARASLDGMARDSEAYANALMAALTQSDHVIRLAAVNELALRPLRPQVVAALRKTLADSDPEVRRAAEEATQAVKP